MNTDIKSLIPSMHAELKRMQSRVAELQVSLQQGSSDEKAIREEISRMNLRQVEIMDVPPLSIQLAGRHYHILPARAEARNVQGHQLPVLFSRSYSIFYF